MNHFWHWAKNETTGQRDLWLEGVIAEESWFDDDITPAAFREELHAGAGPILLHLCSPGGDCIAASQIYTMLMEYPADVIVQIDGLAASAASVIAMAGTTVRMSPTALMMLHNPWTAAMGDVAEMRKAIDLLGEVKEGIINAYELKSGLSRKQISDLMDAETWLSAQKAQELGFCDEVFFSEDQEGEKPSFLFSSGLAVSHLVNLLVSAFSDADKKMPAPVIKRHTAPITSVSSQFTQEHIADAPAREDTLFAADSPARVDVSATTTRLEQLKS